MPFQDVIVEHSLKQELLKLLSRQGTRVPIPVFLAAALIAGLASAYIPTYAWASWLTVVTVVLVIRRYTLSRLPSWNKLSTKKRIRIAIMLSGLNGFTHGLSLLFFPYLTGFEQALQTLVIVGLCAGAVSTTVGFMPIFLAYLLPTLIPISLSWLWQSLSNGFEWVPFSVFILTALFAVILIALAKDAYRLFKESFEIRSQKDRLNQQLQQALQEAESANSAKTRFLASASHDLRQPIHTLSLLGASLSMRDLDDRTRQIAGHMNTALQSLATQLDALLDISKLDAGIVEVNKTSFSLSAMCARLNDEFITVASEKGLAFHTNCPEKCSVYTDAMLFERILRNLISNAIKYTESGDITINVNQSARNTIQIEISDTGVGISDANQKLIFEEFYQVANPERDRAKGLGLGLAIVKRLISLLDTPLTCRSEEAKGTTMMLNVDIAPHILQKNAQINADTFQWNKLTILVIDDEEMVRIGMSTLLESLGAVVFAADGTEEALEIVNEHVPNIVLADFRLRGDDCGLIAIKEIQERHPEVPAILISGDTAPDRLREAQQAGVLLLHKPVSVHELKTTILKTCEKQRDDHERQQQKQATEPQQLQYD